ncbi:MAG: lysozyme inhibitor LprI family protein [Minicystis sp.]
MYPRSFTTIAVTSILALLTACNSTTNVAAEPARDTSAAGASKLAPHSAAADSASAPPATPPAPSTSPQPTLSPTEAANLVATAEKCFADPRCDPAPAEDMYRRAADAGAKDVNCYQFYYGLDVHQDLPRARACFERTVAATKCDGSSPDLDRAYLAAMLIDAQGGPADPTRAMALFTGCYTDMTVQGLAEEAGKRAGLAPDRTLLDFCKDIGGTTITMRQCSSVDGLKVEAMNRRVKRELSTKLDDTGRVLEAKARAAWSAFADKQGQAYGDKYRGGTLQSGAWADHRNALERQRIEALLHLFEYKLSPGADPALADRDLEKTYREASDGDAEHKKLLGAARKAWTAYRDAEVAFYLHVFGEKLGKREVERDVKATLAKKYQADLEDIIRP